MAQNVKRQNAQNRIWTLFDKERNEFIEGEFVPENVTHNISGSLAKEPAVGRDHPIVQWVNGVTEEITFQARMWAHHNQDITVRQRLERLKLLVRRLADSKDPKNSRKRTTPPRPPICSFWWGPKEVLKLESCLIESLGGINYDEIQHNGELRGVTMQLTLVRFEEVTLTTTDTALPDRETRIRRAAQGDTYESIAADEYGDPELGIPLRQLNPREPGMALADLSPLDPVHVFSEGYLLRQPIQPQFHALKTGEGNEAAEDRRREMFDLRDGDSFTTSYADRSASER